MWHWCRMSTMNQKRTHQNTLGICIECSSEWGEQKATQLAPWTPSGVLTRKPNMRRCGQLRQKPNYAWAVDIIRSSSRAFGTFCRILSTHTGCSGLPRTLFEGIQQELSKDREHCTHSLNRKNILKMGIHLGANPICLLSGEAQCGHLWPNGRLSSIFI